MKKNKLIICIIVIIVVGMCIFPYIQSSMICKDVRNERTEEAICKINNMKNVNCATGPMWIRPVLNLIEADIELPLIEACIAGNYEITEVLLKNGADPNMYHKDGFTAVEAVFAGSPGNELEMIKLLASYGADITKSESDDSPLFLAALKMVHTEGERREYFVECVKYLLMYDDELITEKGDSLLHYAAAANQLELMKQVVELDNQLINQINNIGRTALSWAANNNAVEAVEFLLGEGADVSIKDCEGKTAYDYAVENECEEIVRLLEAYR